MFTPKRFKEHDSERIELLIKDFPLATLVASSSDSLEICHLPLYFEKSHIDGELGFLYGHLNKDNPFCKMPIDSKWLVIFQDTGHYISPNWYPDKVVNHKVVPTWNYRSVHFTVEPTFTNNPQKLRQLVGKLSDINEQNLPNSWSIDDAPDEFIDSLCKAIAGFELKITDIEAQFKLSQNKNNMTKDSIIKYLQRMNTDESLCMAQQIEFSRNIEQLK